MHISGRSETEPDFFDGQLHAAGVWWWRHEGEVFLQVVRLDPFVLQSRRKLDHDLVLKVY